MLIFNVFGVLVFFLKSKRGEIDVNPKSSFCLWFNILKIFAPHLVKSVEGLIHQRLY